MSVLLDVADKVDRIESLIESETELRFDLSDSQYARQMLKYIKENPGAISRDIEEAIPNITGQTRQLTKLWHAGYVNRIDDRPYNYFITPKGELALESQQANQSALNEHTDESVPSEKTKPWEEAEISKGQYHALELVNDYDGHPQSADIVDDWKELGYTPAKNSISQLSVLYQDGYVDRTPKPHSYWVAEKGNELLESAPDIE